MNAKISTFFICIEAIIYLLYTLHGCTFNISEKEEQDPARGDQTWEGSTRGEPQARKDINNNDTTNNGVVDKRTDKLTEDDKELERFFQIQIEAMDHCSLLQLEPCEKLPKMKLTKEIEGCVKIVLDQYLIDVNIISEITDKVYAMGKPITFKLGMKQPERSGTAKKDANERNR